MKKTHRFVTFKEALAFLMNNFDMSNQEATHFIWDNQFTMGFIILMLDTSVLVTLRFVGVPVCRSENWHKGGCGSAAALLHYIRC